MGSGVRSQIGGDKTLAEQGADSCSRATHSWPAGEVSPRPPPRGHVTGRWVGRRPRAGGRGVEGEGARM